MYFFTDVLFAVLKIIALPFFVSVAALFVMTAIKKDGNLKFFGKALWKVILFETVAVSVYSSVVYLGFCLTYSAIREYGFISIVLSVIAFTAYIAVMFLFNYFITFRKETKKDRVLFILPLALLSLPALYLGLILTVQGIW